MWDLQLSGSRPRLRWAQADLLGQKWHKKGIFFAFSSLNRQLPFHRGWQPRWKTARGNMGRMRPDSPLCQRSDLCATQEDWNVQIKTKYFLANLCYCTMFSNSAVINYSSGKFWYLSFFFWKYISGFWQIQYQGSKKMKNEKKMKC